MSEHSARVSWSRSNDEVYTDNKFSRGHRWSFDGGAVVMASATPGAVPVPYAVEEYVDPEEAFVAALSSCHMLFFLGLAAKKKYVVDEYIDDAVGILDKNTDGKICMTRVTLRPRIRFSGDNQPAPEQIEALHHKSHDYCYIANSVKTEVVIEPLPSSSEREGESAC